MQGLGRDLRRLAGWWDRFATGNVSDVRHVHGGEATSSAAHVAQALARWHERLAALRRTDGAAAAAVQALCRGLPGRDSFASFRLLDLFQATGVRFDQESTRAGLAGTGIACPPPDEALLDRYLDVALK